MDGLDGYEYNTKVFKRACKNDRVKTDLGR